MPRPDPVLLLHGQPGAARDWDRVRAAIGSPPETIAIDRPGWAGGSAPSDLEGTARAALDALDAAAAQRGCVLGRGFGGRGGAWRGAAHGRRERGGPVSPQAPGAHPRSAAGGARSRQAPAASAAGRAARRDHRGAVPDVLKGLPAWVLAGTRLGVRARLWILARPRLGDGRSRGLLGGWDRGWLLRIGGGSGIGGRGRNRSLRPRRSHRIARLWDDPGPRPPAP